MGGVSCAEDAFEFMLAGASAIAIGSQNFTDPLSLLRIVVEFVDLCDREGIRDVQELIGGLRS
jgi:dihydroorotate dehydrogenase (NAD+) catalytic subunit